MQLEQKKIFPVGLYYKCRPTDRALYAGLSKEGEKLILIAG